MRTTSSPNGVILIQLGTPASTASGDIRRYLRQFLNDRRVLDVPAWLRWALVNLYIAPFRAHADVPAYRKIWGQGGSPLRVHARALQLAVARELGDDFVTELGMRCGAPSIRDAFDRIRSLGARRIIAFPLFPQEAAASSGSALAELLRVASDGWDVPEIRTVSGFYAHPAFLSALASVARPHLEEFAPEHVLMSYHGLPERHVRRSDVSGAHCLAAASCCDSIRSVNANCYRAQCFETARRLAAALGLTPERYSVAFQSRFGRTPWIQPHTEDRLDELARGGVRRLAVLCPSFVADCLETLEEIGIRGRERWLQAGGQALKLIPCLNAAPAWARAVAQIVRETAGQGAEAGLTPLGLSSRADRDRLGSEPA